MRCQTEKNKEILCDEIEKLSGEKMTAENAAKLSTYYNAYRALCMTGGDETSPVAYYTEKPAPTPELDGDTEFERIIMTIPADAEHMIKLTHIFTRHLESLRAVNARAYNGIIEQLKEVAKA